MKINFQNVKSGDKFRHKDGGLYILIQLPFVGTWTLVRDGELKPWYGIRATPEEAFGNSDCFEPYYPLLSKLKDGSVIECIGSNSLKGFRLTLCHVPALNNWLLAGPGIAYMNDSIAQIFKDRGLNPDDFILVK